MSSNTITQMKRAAIADRLIDHFKAPRTAELDARALDLAKRIRAFILADQANLFLSLPDTWFIHTNNVYVYGDDDGDYPSGMHLPETLRVPACMDGRSSETMMPKLSDELLDEFKALCDAKEALSNDARVLRGEVKAALYRFTRLDKLIDEWPEVAPFVNRPDIPSKALPAIKFDVLTDRLGLAVTVAVAPSESDLSD